MKPRIFLLLFSLVPIGSIALGQATYLTNDVQTVIESDSSGIHCGNFNWSPDRLFPKTHWKGEWIWLNKSRFGDFQLTSSEWINDNSRPREYTALFRKGFKLDRVPASAVLCLTADVSFRAYVNGHFVCQGPPNIGSDYADSRPPRKWFFSVHDVRRYLKNGANEVAVEVYSFGTATSETTSGYGKFICDLNEDPSNVILSTDSTWKCEVDTSLTVVNERFMYNATRGISGWRRDNFDDSRWPTASVVDARRDGYLIESQIPSPMRYNVEPMRTRRKTGKAIEAADGSEFLGQVLHNSSMTFEFTRNMSAYYHFSVTANKGDTLKVFPEENSDVNRPLVYICRNGRNTYTTPQLSAFNRLKVEVASDSGLTIDALYAIYSSYPVKYEGSFSCSDPFFTKLWDIIRWSTQMCMQSYHLDSPNHQEPISDTGDYLIESMSNYYAFGDKWLARQDLSKTARMMEKNNYRMFHTSYSLLWVQMLYNYFQYTGDTVLVRTLIPDVNKLNDLFATYLDRNFIVSQAPNYMFMDWISIDGFNAHHPPAVIGTGYLTAFYYESLLDAAYLNRLVGDRMRGERDLKLAGKIKYGINETLWDSAKGLYKDGIPFLSHVKNYIWLPPDTNIVTYSPHFNALAVLYDIAPKSSQKSIMDYVVHQKKIVVQPYFMYFVLSALRHVHDFATDGIASLDKWRDAVDTSTFTLTEKWREPDGTAGDLSHAWGGAPLYFMSSNILGITPAKPGYREIRFRPFMSDSLRWARGTVPLGDGSVVRVSWERKEKSGYTYQLDIPEGHDAVLASPMTSGKYNLDINGRDYGRVTHPVKLHQGRNLLIYSFDGR